VINLIPKEERKKMTIDFYYRFLSLLFLLLSFVVLILSVAILPAYFLSSVKESISNAKLENQKNEGVPLLGQQSLSDVKNINNKLSLVENAEKNKFPISEKVINEILSKKTTDIKITQILYVDGATIGGKISVLGVASSREALLSFERALGDDPKFTNVNLPISSFIKESNIDFDLNLNPS